MGLETDITDIQSLNQNWPPVSDPRAQGADHIRNIKKAVQLSFPNLKQCLLNDAQFTALGTLVGDGSGAFTINGKLTVSDALTVKGTLTVPNVTDWATQQAVGAKDAEGRYLKPGDADKRYLKPSDADGRYVRNLADNQGGIVSATMDASGVPSFQSGTGNWYPVQLKGDYATNPALNTEITNRTNADTNLQNQINNRVLKTGDTSTGGQFVSNKYDNGTLHWAPGWTSVIAGMSGGSSNGDYSFGMWAQVLDDSYTSGIISVNGFQGRKDFRFNEDGNIFTPLGTVALTSQLPFTDQNLRVQVFDVIATDGTFVKIPQAFRTLVGVTAQQHSSTGEGIRPIRVETNVFRGDGFNVSIWDRGGNIQYTFVAYGYF